ncbi:hypothetical protein C1H46_014063 [Malus baccata]|uniref:sucrose synthase n=1 Tax=Malus baccata TaxID=106549 RepID=A0A540MNG0_MALBA|nr:hypothetical protein C1H46_014063 [Malus baccata]
MADVLLATPPIFGDLNPIDIFLCIVHILDQVCALENEMLERIRRQGLDFTPRILIDVAGEVTAELQGYPDFIIGNYSDGNLVASLLAYKMGVTQCTIAHALEKTKYPDSNIYWKKFEEKYHFSTQFTADLIAMNNADFIITSTYQEIAGTQVSRCIRISYRSLSSREGCCTFGRFLSTLQGGS